MFVSRCLSYLMVLMFLVPLGTAQAAVIGLWDFEEYSPGDAFISGSVAEDSSGNARHARSMGLQSLVTGATPGSTAVFFSGTGSASTGFLQFDPGGTFTNSGLTASLVDFSFPGTQNFTLEAIVQLPTSNVNNGGEGGILGKGAFVTDSGVDGWNMTALNFGPASSHPNSVEGFIGDAASGLGTSRIAKPLATGITNGWRHVALVRNRNLDKVEIFIDGVLVDSKVGALANGDLGNTVGNFVIGGDDSSPSKFFNGAIDMVRISDTALDPSEFLMIIPEPSAGAMMLIGTLGLAAFRRRR